jgi:hypothetical protein
MLIWGMMDSGEKYEDCKPTLGVIIDILSVCKDTYSNFYSVLVSDKTYLRSPRVPGNDRRNEHVSLVVRSVRRRDVSAIRRPTEGVC